MTQDSAVSALVSEDGEVEEEEEEEEMKEAWDFFRELKRVVELGNHGFGVVVVLLFVEVEKQRSCWLRAATAIQFTTDFHQIHFILTLSRRFVLLPVRNDTGLLSYGKDRYEVLSQDSQLFQFSSSYEIQIIFYFI